ncbi:hypothetical protein [Rhodopila sp.]
MPQPDHPAVRTGGNPHGLINPRGLINLSDEDMMLFMFGGYG